MNSIYRCKILKDLELVLQFHKHDFILENAKKLKLEIIQDPNYHPNYKFIIDLRKANFQFTDEEIEEYGSFVSEKVKLEGLNRVALLTNTPEQVVKSTLFALNKTANPTQYKIFSTLGGAMCWLDIDLKYMPLIESEINRLDKD